MPEAYVLPELDHLEELALEVLLQTRRQVSHPEVRDRIAAAVARALRRPPGPPPVAPALAA